MNFGYGGDSWVGYPSFLFELLDKQVIFVGLSVGGTRGEYVVAIGELYELYDVGWLSVGPSKTHRMFGSSVAMNVHMVVGHV